MTAVILQICVGLAGIVALWMKQYYSAANTAARQKEAEHEAIQTDRQDLVDGNTDAISIRIDSLCSGPGGSGNAGSEGSTDKTGPNSTISRLADLGIRTE